MKSYLLNRNQNEHSTGTFHTLVLSLSLSLCLSLALTLAVPVRAAVLSAPRPLVAVESPIASVRPVAAIVAHRVSPGVDKAVAVEARALLVALGMPEALPTDHAIPLVHLALDLDLDLDVAL